MIRIARLEDVTIVTELALKLWPEHEFEELKEEFENILSNENSIVFLAFKEDVAIAFAQCELRFDYVEGTESSPVAYLEGIYVEENYRKHGIAKELVKHCEAWGREKDCTEFGSDCELDNTDSLNFHLGIGFEEANRIICFKKNI